MPPEDQASQSLCHNSSLTTYCSLGTQRRAMNDTGSNKEEWKQRKKEIYYYYMLNKLDLSVVRKLMSDQNFNASQAMYKRRFKSWGWKKYRKSEGHATAGGGGGPVSETHSSNRTIIMLGPPNPRISTSISSSFPDKKFNSLLDNVRNLFLSSIFQQKWKVSKLDVIEEDEYDDLLVDVAMGLRNCTHLKPNIGFKGIRKAFIALEKVVADCGLFSLPVIWGSYLRMIRTKHRQLAKSFILHALQLAKGRFSPGSQNYPFVEALLNLWELENTATIDPTHLEQVVIRAYKSCIEHTKVQLGPENLTTLSLWGDFVVYLDGSSINETKAVVNNIRGKVEYVEQEHGIGGDYTLDLLGTMLYVLQSHPTMADEAEVVAQDMLVRIEQRKNAGGILEKKLQTKQKDLHQVLANIEMKRKRYRKAISHLKDFLDNEIEDGRDALALQKLEECYVELGEHRSAYIVWQRQAKGYQSLFPQDDTEQSRCAISWESRSSDEITDTSTLASSDTKSSEGTIPNTEAVEDEVSDFSNVEAEIKIAEEKVDQWQQR